MLGTQIIGTGSAFPEKIMTNAEFESFLDTNDEWIRTRTGIETRRIADPKKGETTLTLALSAAKRALEAAQITADQLDLILVATITPESVMPTTAIQIQEKIHAHKAFCFDLQAACAGFLYALSVADNFIKSGTIQRALVIGADTLSTITDWKDRSTCVLFGDGSGAVVVQKTTDPQHQVLALDLYTDGRHGSILKIPHGYSAMPPYSEAYRVDQHCIKMQGKEVFKLAVRNMSDASKKILDKLELSADDIQHFFFHQANLRILEACAKRLSIPLEKCWLNVQKYGNTSAATIPICIDEAVRAKALKPGQLVLMSSFGGGLAWGAGVFRL